MLRGLTTKLHIYKALNQEMLNDFIKNNAMEILINIYYTSDDSMIIAIAPHYMKAGLELDYKLG